MITTSTTAKKMNDRFNAENSWVEFSAKKPKRISPLRLFILRFRVDEA